MSTIHVTSCIHAPVERIFNLSRSTSLHKAVLRSYKKGTLESRGEGLMNVGDKISFRLSYLGRQRELVTKIDVMEDPKMFVSTLVRGSFRNLRHEHHFKPIENGTLLIDLLEYEPAYGAAGKWADGLLIRSFLKKYLEAKNRLIKQYAEGEKWKVILPEKK
ncbi:SRPBCC family protein [Dinghuibacter silviterrae]|uniref:Ligand-binding SRPBCC domain-containing protein n=1 Tax=Dinghuibacter silviterrae TaxID=1539049 RepID=A0A4R8DPK8_9BACT|nr:SRPBCC family protein [Dinghuibacter silviterrae]TDW99675.1 ligand-binding SRPBCC domain-containing protein [Dinghuibacter silviterrae]